MLTLEGQYTAAEAPLLASYKVWTSNPASHGDELAFTRKDLMKVYEALGRKSDVERLQTESGHNGVLP